MWDSSTSSLRIRDDFLTDLTYVVLWLLCNRLKRLRSLQGTLLARFLSCALNVFLQLLTWPPPDEWLGRALRLDFLRKPFWRNLFPLVPVDLRLCRDGSPESLRIETRLLENASDVGYGTGQ